MKRFLAKRWHGIPVGIITAVLLVCMLAGSAFAAAFTLPVPSTVTVATGSCDIEAYSDSACTTELTSIDWGDMRRGTSASQKVYIKWIGDADFGANVSVSYTDFVPVLPYPDDITVGFSTGEFSFNPNDPGWPYVWELTITLNVGAYAPAGLASFTINFDSDPIPPPP